jgi:RNA-directed DNA polymerase
MNDDKTHLTDVTPRERVGSERRAITFLGFNVFFAKTRAGTGLKLVYQTDRKRLSRALVSVTAKMRLWMHEPVHQQAKRINRVLRGHFNYYGMPGNAAKLDTFAYVVRRYWRQCLSKRSQNGKVTWDRMNALLEKHPLVAARLRINYQLLDAYSVL